MKGHTAQSTIECSHPKTPHILKKLGKLVSCQQQHGRYRLKLCVGTPIKARIWKYGFWLFLQNLGQKYITNAVFVAIESGFRFTSVLITAAFPGLKQNKAHLPTGLQALQNTVFYCGMYPGSTPLSVQPYCRVRTTPTPYLSPLPPPLVKSPNSWDGTKNLEEAFSISLEMSKLHGRLWVFYDLL